MRDADVASNYASRPLSIGHGQTISQPYIMALMMEILDLRRDDWVLEIGTRSGCQTAFLNELVGRVFSIKVVETLAAAALRCLQDLGAIPSRCAPERAPFDAIIDSAAPEHIPQTLGNQMKPGGRLAVPIGRVHEVQFHYLGTRTPTAASSHIKTLPVASLPMIHERRNGEPLRSGLDEPAP